MLTNFFFYDNDGKIVDLDFTKSLNNKKLENFLFPFKIELIILKRLWKRG